MPRDSPVLATFFQELGRYIEAGGWVMPPLIVATVVLWYAIGYRAAALKRGTKRGARNLLRRIQHGKLPHRDGVLVRAANKALALKATGLEDLRPYLDDAFAESEQEIRKYNVLITTIVLAAPLLGLLGTVIGMIRVFTAITVIGVGDPGQLAGGISEALITTAAGLTIAIPSLIFHRHLKRKIDDLVVAMEQEAMKLVEFLHGERSELA